MTGSLYITLVFSIYVSSLMEVDFACLKRLFLDKVSYLVYARIVSL